MKVKGVVDYVDSFQDDINIYIVMELCQGEELWKVSNGFGIPDKKQYYEIIISIVETLK